MGNKTKKINIINKIKKTTWEDVNNKRFTLLGMGSELGRIADKESEKYKQLKNKYDELEADIQEMISYLDGSHNAQKLIEAAKKAKDERDKAISRKGTKSKELEEKLGKLEFKREEEIQKIMKLRGAINRIYLLPEDKEYDEVSQKAEEWKMQNEMIKCSLNLRRINARIGMTKIRKSDQDAKDIENIKKVIDTYNERITEYKKKMDELNNKRPKSIPEKYMRENDWILGVVTIDKNKKLQEVIDKIDEENREIREFEQGRYLAKAVQEDSKLPYKELNNKERNELIKYSEEMTTFEKLTEFVKIKAARAAGKAVGLTILAVRKIKSIFKQKEEIKTIDAVEETQKIEEGTFVEESKNAIEETVNENASQKPMEEQAEETMEKLDVDSSPKPATKAEATVSQDTVQVVNPFKLRIAADNDVKKAIESIPTIERKGTKLETEKEIDTNTFE